MRPCSTGSMTRRLRGWHWRPGPKSRRRSRSADLPTVTASPYLVRFGGSKYGVTAVMQIIRQRAAAAEKKYITQIHSRWRHWQMPRFTQQMAHWFQSLVFVSGIPSYNNNKDYYAHVTHYCTVSNISCMFFICI